MQDMHGVNSTGSGKEFPVSTKRLAAIDIGTNSIRSVVVEVDQQGRVMYLDDEKATVRLGENLAVSGMISPAAFSRAVDAMAHIRKLIDGFKVADVEAVATSAMRSAGNGGELVQLLSRELGREVRIISGEEEAELVALSARHNFDMSGKRHALLDIGGGSVEIVLALGTHVEEFFSLDLGAVVMTERFFSGDPITPGDMKRFQQHVRSLLKKRLPGREAAVQTFIGSGGTMTSLGGMVMAMRRQEFVSLQGYEVLRSELVHLIAMLIRKDLKSRRVIPGLNPDRADIIVAGLAVVDEIMRHFGANRIVINERGIREGLILRCMKRLGLQRDTGVRRTWRESVREFAVSCHVDDTHARHVAKLALCIFDGLEKNGGFKKGDRRLLEAAALLHDIGYFISYSSHHKHSYHLIRHADLLGFTPREREIMAQVARYHRKALPKKKHEEYGRLHEKDQLLVRRLGGILRLADGLDRRRSGLVEVVGVHVAGGETVLRLLGTEDISVEIHGGSSKKDLFEKAYSCRVVFDVR